MGLSRKKAPSSAPGGSEGSSRERFLAFFSSKKPAPALPPTTAEKRERDRERRANCRQGRRPARTHDVTSSNSSDEGRDSVRLRHAPPNAVQLSSSSSSSSSSCLGVFPQRSSRSSSLQWSTRSSSSSTSSLADLDASSRRHKTKTTTPPPRRRRSSSSDSSTSLSAASLSSLAVAEPREMWRESSLVDFLSCFPRDLTADVRVTCHVFRPRKARAYLRGLILSLEFEIRATKWAAYFLQLVHEARDRHQLSLRAAISIKWAICAHVQGEAQNRQIRQQRLDQTLQRKMTEYRVALQCVAGTSVVKFGRKGKPHATTLCVENGDTLRWTSKLLAQATQLAVGGVTATTTMGKKRAKAKNAIPLASIVSVKAGPTTNVLARALHKGALALEDAKCTLSVVTPTRTLDLKAKSPAEREWLQRSLEFLVELARDHERRVAQQVELTIMRRMETLAVWKHGRKGRPHKTRVFVDRFGEVSWLGRSGDSLQLDEIIVVEEGLRTPVFARARAAGLVTVVKATHCFSLVTSLRSLDIEAANEQQRDWFVVAFRYLLDKVHEKTAAMQRERAEKQLRMLQELCREDDDDDGFLTGDGDDIYYDGRPARLA